MFIKEIYLKNFRNYDEQKIRLNETVNDFYGNNAQGKTNILEALYFCALGRSFRTHKESELINFKDSFSNINVSFQKNDRDNSIEISLNKKNSKVIKLNGIKLSKKHPMWVFFLLFVRFSHYILYLVLFLHVFILYYTICCGGVFYDEKCR